jgi:predicted nucleic acid-binding protein
LAAGVHVGHSHLRQALAQIRGHGKSGWLELLRLESPDEFALYEELARALDLGEASCLALAAHRQLSMATDDAAARRIASRLGVPLTGTVGILGASVREGQLALPAANAILAGMIRAGYYSPVETLDEVV